MYIKVSEGVIEQWPYTLVDLRNDNPTVSFPTIQGTIPDEVLEQYKIFAVTELDEPDYDPSLQTISLNAEPVETENGWVLDYTITDKTAEELAEDEEATAATMRNDRNTRLTACDWVVIRAQELNEAVSTEWAEYRQALRDITTHTNFPFLEESDWPVEPSV